MVYGKSRRDDRCTATLIGITSTDLRTFDFPCLSYVSARIGKFKLETTQDGRMQPWDFKFSLRGCKRAINWCTAVIDDTMTETINLSTLAVAAQWMSKTLAINPH